MTMDYANKWLKEVKDLELYHNKTDPKPKYIRIKEAYLAGAEPREKQIAELEDKLANADYQLEGRDNEIRELENAIEGYKNQIFYKEKALAKVKKEKDRIVHRVTKDKKRLIRRNIEFKAQIEKMKCCGNCKWNNSEGKFVHPPCKECNWEMTK